ncbi:MAG: glycoside-pentoside-hexuronide (GPH):cation symporter [Clostridia bacterium]
MGKAEKKPRYKKFMSLSEVLAYSVGLFGFQLIIGFLNSYQAEFYGSIMGASLAVVGILILIGKIVSAGFDPIVGNLIDRNKSKHGKLKPFILYSLIPLFLLTIVIFIKVPFSGAGLYVYIFITNLLWCLSMTLGDVPSQGIASVLTPSSTERTDVVSIANTFKAIGFAAAGAIVPIVCICVAGGSKVFTANDDPISSLEFLVTAIVIALLGCLMFSLIFFKNKERVQYKAEKMSFKDMWFVFKDNKPLMLVVISYFLGFGRQMQMGIQIQAANVFMQGQNSVLLLGIPMAIGSMLSMVLVPILIKKFDEKKVFIGMSLYGFIISLATFFVGTNTMWLMLTMLGLCGLQFGAVTIMPIIMTADCVDYYEWKTGKRNEGTAYALLTLTIKVGIALGTALALILVGVSGYKADAATFSAGTKNWVYAAYALLPGIFSLLAIIPMLKYDIVGKKKLQINEELQERRAKFAQENAEENTID